MCFRLRNIRELFATVKKYTNAHTHIRVHACTHVHIHIHIHIHAHTYTHVHTRIYTQHARTHTHTHTHKDNKWGQGIAVPRRVLQIDGAVVQMMTITTTASINNCRVFTIFISSLHYAPQYFYIFKFICWVVFIFLFVLFVVYFECDHSCSHLLLLVFKI